MTIVCAWFSCVFSQLWPGVLCNYTGHTGLRVRQTSIFYFLFNQYQSYDHKYKGKMENYHCCSHNSLGGFWYFTGPTLPLLGDARPLCFDDSLCPSPGLSSSLPTRPYLAKQSPTHMRSFFLGGGGGGAG